ncbi:MAG: hypothetical protein JNL82_17095 [Myxococcales bacterium]|nr:hypothetical protein [Myxococcales bacterium]
MPVSKRLGLACISLFTVACGDDGQITDPGTSVGPTSLTLPSPTTTNASADTGTPTTGSTTNASSVMTDSGTTEQPTTNGPTTVSTGPVTTVTTGEPVTSTGPETDSGVSATVASTSGTSTGGSTTLGSSSEGPQPICEPGQVQCVDDTNFETCSGDGLMWEGPTACGPKLVCSGGQCLSKCDLAEQNLSSIGCRYYAIDANNDPVENFDTQPYAVAVSNVDPLLAAEVQIQAYQNGQWTTIQMGSVMPKQLSQFTLPDKHVNYTAINLRGAYRIISDIPIIAYQFQPINGQTSFTSDASLLLPSSTYDSYYFLLGWGEPSFGNAQFNVVASQDNTQVTVTPTTNTVAGGGIPALAANVPYNLPIMQEGDVIQIEANNLFAGSYITSDKPIAVFSTHWCANVPTQNCCCDHLEEQLYGLTRWGTTYVASRWPKRANGNPEASVWQIIAAEDNTTVNFIKHAEVTGIPQPQIVMNKAQVVTYQVSGSVANPGDFVIDADKPVFAMQYLTTSASSGQPDATKAGDPAMAQAIPSEQYRSNYVVLVPAAWTYDYFVVTKKINSMVTLDGVAIAQNQFTRVGPADNPTEWEVARLQVADGVHALDGDQPFGVITLGYDQYDSYAYPGGLDQKVINPQ